MQVPPDIPKLYWLIWFIVGFGAMETYAIVTDQLNWTFSYTVQWLVGAGDSDTREWYRWLARIVLIVLLLWLVPHWLNKWRWF